MIRHCLFVAAIVGIQAFCGSATPSFAAPIGNATWTGGGGSGNWSTSSNWTTIPTTSGTWNLSFGGATQTTSTNTIGTITLGTLSFSNDGSSGRTGVFTLSGSTLALSNGQIITTAGIGTPDTVANALTLTGSSTVTLNNGHGLNLTGDVSGSGSITAVGSGTNTAILYLAGTNSYSGNTYVTGVRVQNALGSSIANTGDTNNNAFGTGDVYVSGSGTVLIRNASTIANNFTLGGDGTVISGIGAGAIRGSFGVGGQTATLSGTVTLSDNATLKTASTGGLSGNKMVLSGPVNLGSRVLTLSPGASGTNATPIEITGAINGTGGIVVNGTGSSVLLSGANGYTGGTTIASGTLRAGNGTALGTGALAVNGGGLDLNGQSLAIGTLSGSSGGVIASSVAGAASLTSNSEVLLSNYLGTITDGAGVVSLIKTGVGQLDLSGSNSHTGGTTVTAGRIQNVNGSSLVNQGGTNDYAFGTGLVTASGSGTIVVRNSSTIANNFNIGGDGMTSGSSTLGAIRGSFGVNNQTATLTGTVSLSSNAKITTAASTGLTGNSMVLSGPISLGAHTLTFAPGVSGSDPLPIFVSGAINGSGGVVVNGASTVYFNAANTYTGDTTVTAGTLAGSGTIAGAVNLQSGTIAPGGSAGAIDTLTVGSLQFGTGAAAAMTISDLVNYDRIVSTGTVNFGSTGGSVAVDFLADGFANFSVWQLFSGSSFTGQLSSFAISGSYGTPTFAYADGEWKADIGGGQTMSFYEDNRHAIGDRYKAGQLVVVPEPSSLAIAGIGLCVAGWYRLRRRRHRLA